MLPTELASRPPRGSKAYVDGEPRTCRVPFCEVACRPRRAPRGRPRRLYDTSGPGGDPAGASNWRGRLDPRAGRRRALRGPRRQLCDDGRRSRRGGQPPSRSGDTPCAPCYRGGWSSSPAARASTPNFVRDEVARGRMVIPANTVHHPESWSRWASASPLPARSTPTSATRPSPASRRRAGEAAPRRPPRRRHRHGPVHRRQHRRHPPGDHRRLAGADRHRADLPGDPEGQGPADTSPGRCSSTWSSTRPSRASTT